MILFSDVLMMLEYVNLKTHFFIPSLGKRQLFSLRFEVLGQSFKFKKSEMEKSIGDGFVTTISSPQNVPKV